MPNADAEINVSLTFRHTESTDALKKYATEKLSQCIKKYVRYVTDVQVRLTVEKRDHIAEVTVHSKGVEVSGKAVTEDLYQSIDKVADTIETQLRKHKERTVQHHNKHQDASFEG